MRIVSKFKDFYDFASFYRDTDPRSHYWERHTRNEAVDKSKLVRNFRETQYENWDRSTYVGLPRFRTSNRTGKRYGLHEEYVVVGDKIVSFWKDIDELNDRVVNPGVVRPNEPLYSTDPDFKQRKWKRWIGWKKQIEITTHPIVSENNYSVVIELQEKYKSPILHLSTDSNYLNVIVNPRLVDYHIQNILDPQQTYQDIEMWFANQKFDREEPIPQTDKQKILTHGLDPKTSFRHPIK